MKKHLFTLLLFSLGIFAYAQDFTSAEDSDPRAKKILDNLNEEYQGFNSVSIDFKLEIEIPGEQVERQAGSIIQKGEKFKFDMGPQALYCNGNEIWVHLKDMNEVQINDFEAEDQAEFISPKELLSLYDSGKFAYAISFEGDEEGEFVTQIEFKVLDPESEYSKMRLTLAKDKTTVKRLKVFSKDGSRYTMNLVSLDAETEIEDDAFEFDLKAHPDIYVEDLRL